MENKFYRNQTSTLTQIAMLSRMRITTAPEATAFIRAIIPLLTQLGGVIQNASLREQQAINRALVAEQPEPIEEPAPVIVAEPISPFTPENLFSEEGYTEEELAARIEKLKITKEKAAKYKAEQARKDKETKTKEA